MTSSRGPRIACPDLGLTEVAGHASSQVASVGAHVLIEIHGDGQPQEASTIGASDAVDADSPSFLPGGTGGCAARTISSSRPAGSLTTRGPRGPAARPRPAHTHPP